MSTDAFEQLIDVAAPGGGSYPVQRGHRRGVRSPHTFDAARWPPSSLTSPYAPQGSTTAVLALLAAGTATATAVEQRQISISPTSGPAGSKVTVTGSGWIDYVVDGVLITLDGVGIVVAHPNDGGNFTTVISIPDSYPPGAHSVSAIYGNGSGWTVAFTVLPPLPP